jgi:hypothetical protein
LCLVASGLKFSVHLYGKDKNKGDDLPLCMCIRPMMKQWPVLEEASRNPYYFSEYLDLIQEEKAS